MNKLALEDFAARLAHIHFLSKSNIVDFGKKSQILMIN